MTFTFDFKQVFSDEFKRIPADLQDKVLDFTDLYELHGLVDFNKYPGKVTYSWRNLIAGTSEYNFAYSNELWHYHVGYPQYKQTFHGKYMTSDWVLHFQWRGKGQHIDLVDLYDHTNSAGGFWLPKAGYLADKPLGPSGDEDKG